MRPIRVILIGAICVICGFSSSASAQINGRQAFSNTNVTIKAGVGIAAQTGTLTEPRTVTLPAAAAYPRGEGVWVVDESGSLDGNDGKLFIQRAGSDTINGATTSAQMWYAYQALFFRSNGSNKWTVSPAVATPMNGSRGLFLVYDQRGRVVIAGDNGTGITEGNYIFDPADESAEYNDANDTTFVGFYNGQYAFFRDPVYLYPVDAAPDSPSEGFLYANSTNHHFYFYNGTTFVQVDGAALAANNGSDFTNKATFRSNVGGEIGTAVFDGDNAVANVVVKGIVASVSYDSTGTYIVTFGSAQADANYVVSATADESLADPVFCTVAKSTTSLTVKTHSSSSTLSDAVGINVTISRLP